MSAPQVIPWGDWALQVTDQGIVTAFDETGKAIISAGLPWADPNDQITVVTYPDEFEITVTNGSAQAVVRHTVDTLWTVHVRCDAEFMDTGRELVFSTPTVLGCWAAGEAGWVVVRRRRDLLVGELVAGLALLMGTGGSAVSYAIGGRATFRFDHVADERALAAKLPAWWPERTTAENDEAFELNLVDGAVDHPDAVLTETSIIIPGQEYGWQSIHVYAGRKHYVLTLGNADDLRGTIEAWAHDIINASGVASPAEALLLAKAIDLGIVPDTRRANRLIESRAQLVRGVGITGPLDASLVTTDALRRGDLDTLAANIAELSQSFVMPGTGLAWLEAAIPLTMAGIAVPEPPRRLDDLSFFERTYVLAEDAMLGSLPTDPVPAPVEDLLHLLGAGLPVHYLNKLQRSQVIALARMAPDHWAFPAWPHDLGTVIQQAQQELLTGRVTNEILIWLAWQ